MPPRLRNHENPSPLQVEPSSSTKIPLFLTHDGGGTIFGYACLDPLGRTTYGIHNAHFDDGGFWHGGIAEMARHYVELIEDFGSADGFNTEWSERLHIDYAKLVWSASNRKDEYPQMTLWLQRREQLRAHQAYVQ